MSFLNDLVDAGFNQFDSAIKREEDVYENLNKREEYRNLSSDRQKEVDERINDKMDSLKNGRDQLQGYKNSVDGYLNNRDN